MNMTTMDVMNHTGMGMTNGSGMGSNMSDTMDMSNMNDEVTMDMGNQFCMSMSMFMDGSSGGGGMIMYMEGFRWSLTGNQPCLNLYFPGWTLDTKGKFVTAMIGIFTLAIMVEGIAKLRYRIVQTAKKSFREPNMQPWNPQVLRGLVTIMHGLQAFVGYILMLATMTFSVEFLICVVFGLSAGYAIFFRVEETLLQDSHVTTNPCCAFMEEEAREMKSSATSDVDGECECDSPFQQLNVNNNSTYPIETA